MLGSRWLINGGGMYHTCTSTYIQYIVHMIEEYAEDLIGGLPVRFSVVIQLSKSSSVPWVCTDRYVCITRSTLKVCHA